MARSAGIESLTVHKVRRTFSTALAAVGTHPSTMQAGAGHSDPKIVVVIHATGGDVSKKAAAEGPREGAGKDLG